MKQLILVLAVLVYSQNVFAQEEALETYEPPPLFAEPKFPTPKIKKPPVDVIEPISKEVPETKTLPVRKENPVEPKTAPLPNVKPKAKLQIKETEVELPEPAQKPAQVETKFKTINTDIIEEPSEELAGEPIELLQKAEPKNDGVVTGPKTMPSNKKEDVLSEEIFVNDQEINLIERVQSEEDKPLAVIPVGEIAEFPEDKTNLILVFKKAQSDLNDEVMDNELFPLAKYLAGNSKSLEIKAYASAATNRPNSDRRIALDRGLAIREFLVAQQIEPHRINLKSFGDNTTRQPTDFVEINIID